MLIGRLLRHQNPIVAFGAFNERLSCRRFETRGFGLNDATHRNLVSRMLACWPGKALMFVTLVPLFNAFYFLPQWVAWRAPVRLPMTIVDRLVPFDPGWVYVYVSMYVMLLIPPLLTTRGESLWRYTISATIMFLAAAVFFVLWPVEYPRPALTGVAPWVYHIVISLDRPVNSIPSLHAGLVAYTLFFAARALDDVPVGMRRSILWVGTTWSAAILYATLATKQHYLLDLPAGVLLAWLAHALAWRGAARPAAVAQQDPEAVLT